MKSATRKTEKSETDDLRSFIEVKKNQNKALKKMMEKITSSHQLNKSKHNNNIDKNEKYDT